MLQTELLEKSAERIPLWRRILFGFWPSAIALFFCLVACIALNFYWSETGSLGFESLSGNDAAEGRFSQLEHIPLLLIFRTVSAVIATAVPIEAVVGTRRYARMKGNHLPLGGFEVRCACTIWTWIGMSLYFLQVAGVTAFWLTGSTVSPTYAAVLWVLFEVMYAFSWLVFLAVWLALLPMAHFSGHKDAVKLLLYPTVLFQHNANLILMETKLLLSRWTMQPEHVIFSIYFGIVYVIFNWWLHSKTGFWIYFFLDYNHAGVPSLLVLLVSIYAFYWVGVFSAGLVT